MNLEKVKILVVDDNVFMRTLIRMILNAFHCTQVREAADGDEAWDLITSDYFPDLIITDWLMPNLDGIELIKRIRTDKTSPYPHIPIIMVTSYSEKFRIEAARDAGANEILVKPFSAEGLYRRIKAAATRPRDAVKSEDFTGPDRRRRKNDVFKGKNRRSDQREEPPPDTVDGNDSEGDK